MPTPSDSLPDPAAATREALLEAAETTFARAGYAEARLELIVAAAGVSKGALYHHYSGKQALFEAVVERLGTGAADRVRGRCAGIADPWDRTTTGVGLLLVVAEEPSFARIVVQDAPAVLGAERYRAHERRTTYACLLELLTEVLPAAAAAPATAFALEAALRAGAADHETALTLIVGGLRALAAT